MTFACQTELPAQEMVAARQAIKLAYDAQADKFAPDLLKQASDKLMASHEALKKDKPDEALKLAVEAKQDAESAAAISWPLLSAESLHSSKTLYAQAENLDAHKAAPSQMRSAAAKIAEAETHINANNYQQSYKASQAAIQDISVARDLSLASLAELSTEANQLKQLLLAFKDDPHAKPFSADITSAENNLNQAFTDIRNNNVKEASVKISEVREQTDRIKASLLAAREAAEKAAQTAAIEKPKTITTDKPAEKKPVAKNKTTTDKNIYTVKYFETNKDCLWRISQKVYNDPSLWTRIYMANRDKIKNPDLIFPGQKLVIPKVAAVKKSPAKKTTQKTITTKTKKSTVTNKTNDKAADKRTTGKTDEKAAVIPDKKDGITGKTDGTSSGGTATPGGAGKAPMLPDGIFRENQ